MTTQIHLTFNDVQNAVVKIVDSIIEELQLDDRDKTHTARSVLIHGIPRGGVPVAYAVCAELIRREYKARPVAIITGADVVVDDIVDSGATMKKARVEKPDAYFYSICNKEDEGIGGAWVVFPWDENVIKSAEDIPTRLMQLIGEDVKRDGLRGTPERFVQAWMFWNSGYSQNAADVLTTFGQEDNDLAYDEMILVKDIPVWSMCEHHFAPFFGVAHIGYIPSEVVVGLSKVIRLLEVFARRLQVQERLTVQVAAALEEHLQPQGVGVVLECRHTCIESRGVQKAGVATVTSALRGVFRDVGKARAEFFSNIEHRRDVG